MSIFINSNEGDSCRGVLCVCVEVETLIIRLTPITFTTVFRVNYGMSATWRSRELTVPTGGAVTMETAGREACGIFFSIYRRVWI